MVSNIINVTTTDIEVEPPGRFSFLSFQKRITIPLSHIDYASMDYGIMNGGGILWKLAGYSLFGTNIGLFAKNGVRAYINIRDGEMPLLIQLHDEKYDQLILGVEDPQEVISQIYHPQTHDFGSNTGITDVKEQYSRSDRIFQISLSVLVIIGLASVFLQFLFPAENRFYFANVVVGLVIVLILLNVLLRTVEGRRKQHDKTKKRSKYFLSKVAFGFFILSFLFTFFGTWVFSSEIIGYFAISQVIFTFIFLLLYIFKK